MRWASDAPPLIPHQHGAWAFVALPLAFALLFAVNIRFARAGAERSLTNDLILVLECTAMVPVMVGVGAGFVLYHPTACSPSRSVSCVRCAR